MGAAGPTGDTAPTPAPHQTPTAAPPATLPSLPAAESHDDLGQPFSAGSLRAEPPPPEPFDPSKLFPQAPAVPAPMKPPASTSPKPVPVTTGVHPAGPPIEFNFGESPDIPRLTLRALLLTDDDPTPDEIVAHSAGLEGVAASIAILPSGVVSASCDAESGDVGRFVANAPRAYEYLTGLAESMGIEGSGSFTLRSGSGIRTFFIERGICLAVLHGASPFGPGVRDRLVLTARLLADITD
jgi:hypothetical protein